MSEPFLLERQGAVAIISINDAPLNRMTVDYIDELEVLLEKRKPIFNQP